MKGNWIIPLVSGIVLFLFSLLSAQAASWGPEVRLTNLAGQSWGPRIAAYNGILHVVWFEYSDSNMTVPKIHYIRSTDNGNSWSQPQRIGNTDPARHEIFPSIAADANGVYVVWSSNSAPPVTIFRRSTDGGFTWGTEKLFPTNAPGSYSRATDILVDRQGGIHIAWYDNRQGYSGIYHAQSCDHGATWSAEQWLTQFDGMVDNEDPKIVQAEDNTFYLLFRSSRDGMPQGGFPPSNIYLLRGQSSSCSTGTTTWLYPAQRVSQSLPDEYSNNYSGAISSGQGDRLHIAFWNEKAGNNIAYRRCIPAVSGCAKQELLTDFPLTHPQAQGQNRSNPGVTEDDLGGVHLFYSEHAQVVNTLTMGKLFYRNSGDGGINWNPSTQLGTSSLTASPQAIYHKGRVHIVWIDYRINNFGTEIYYRNLDLNIKLTPLNDTAEFVRQQYRDFLNREADDGGLQYWVNLIDTGAMTKAQVIESFFWSQEFGVQIAPVARLYFAYFLRIPDYGGLQYWINEYKNGKPLQWISGFFAASQEFQQRYGSLNNQQFVELIYQNILGRLGEASGVAYWTGELDSERQTRGQVMLGFSESPEYKQTSSNEVYVTMMYIGMLRRSPEEGGFNFWVNYLDSGNSGLALINGFLSSAEYANRFQ